MTPKPKERKEWGILGLLVALLLLIFLGRLLADAQGTEHLWLVSYSWLLIAGITFVLGLVYYAQYVSPLRGEEGWVAGLVLLLEAYIKVAEKALDFSQPEPKKKKEVPAEMVDNLPASLKSLNAGFIRGYQVLAITKGSSYVRPAGPGFVVLYKGEQIWRVIDLRPQLRSQPVKTKTRDGISVETAVTVIFQVQRDQTPGSDDLLYPFNHEAIFHLSYDETVDEQGNRLPWTRQLTPPAAAILATEIPKYSLNELIRSEEDASPLEEIRQIIFHDLRRRFLSRGIELLNVSLGGLTLPDGIRDQQFLTWQAEWQRKIKLEQASGDAEVVRLLKQAQARAQIEIIENIMHSIDTMRQGDDTDLSQVIMLRMIEALEGAVSAGSVQALVPQQLMASLVRDASRQMQSWVAPTTAVEPPSLGSGHKVEELDE